MSGNQGLGWYYFEGPFINAESYIDLFTNLIHAVLLKLSPDTIFRQQSTLLHYTLSKATCNRCKITKLWIGREGPAR